MSEPSQPKRSSHSSILAAVYRFVLGTHPYNTICSFNYHNVRHITRFLRTQRTRLPGTQLVLVDVGAGGSPYFDIFASACASYVAVDHATAFSEGEDRAILRREGTAEALPIESSSADVVLCNQVLEHVDDPQRTVAEAHRVLRPGGLFLGSVPHISPVHLEPHDFRRYTDLGLRQLLVEAGFESPTIEGNGGVHSAAALLVAMDWVLSPRRDGTPQMFRPLRAFSLAPIVGCLNLGALAFDRLLGDSRRSPANLCWSARKPVVMANTLETTPGLAAGR